MRFFERIQLRLGGQHIVQRRHRPVRVRLLRHPAPRLERQAAFHPAAVERDMAEQSTEKRRFAGSVAPVQRDALSFRNVERNVPEQRPAVDFFRQIDNFGDQHAHSPAPFRLPIFVIRKQKRPRQGGLRSAAWSEQGKSFVRA